MAPPFDFPSLIKTGAPGETHKQRELRKANLVAASREIEALRLYEPLPFQERLHRCTAKEVVVRKGNQCGGCEKISEPVLTPDGWVAIGELRVGDRVIGGDGKPCNVTGVFPKGVMAIFRLTFDDGASVCCTNCHAWRCLLKKTERFKSHEHYQPEKWRVYTLEQIRSHGGDDPAPRDKAVIPVACAEHPYRHIPIAPYTLGALLGDGSFSQQSVSLTTGDNEIADRIIDELPEGIKWRITPHHEGGQCSTWHFTGPGGVGSNQLVNGLRMLGLMGHRGETKFIPKSYLFNSVDVRTALLQGLMDTDGYCGDKSGKPYFYTSSPQLASDVVDLVRSLGGKAWIRWKETSVTIKSKKRGTPIRKKIPGEQTELFDKYGVAERKPCLNMAEVSMSFGSDVQIFGLKRKQERRSSFQDKRTRGRVLQTIRPEGNDECVCISVDSPDHTYITRDYIVTHNSLAGFVEDARAVLNCDPHNKYPKSGVLVCLGYGEKHIGRVIYKYLFRPGAFDIIRDLETGKWRTYRPWLGVKHGKQGDLERASESRPAPPLIPNRFIDGKISWEKRSDHVFSRVMLKTGWEIIAANTAGDSEQCQGFQADLVHLDEDTASEGWYREMVGRCSKRNGKLRWTALPHSKNDELMNVIQRAEDEASSDNPTTVLVSATIYDNPYLPEEAVEANAKLWRSEGEDIYRQRALGELSVGKILMYPTFNIHVHEAIKESEPRLKVQEFLANNNGHPGDDWMRVMVVDPGHAVCAVLFGAVPPPQIFGDHLVVYNLLYLLGCDATMFGNEVYNATKEEHVRFQKFIIDAHGGQLRDIGSGVHPRKQYENKLKEKGVSSIDTRHGFKDGCDDVKGRETLLREAFRIRTDGTSRLLIVGSRCAPLVKELTRFKKKTAKRGGMNVIIDEGNRVNTHAIECLEMMVADGCAYVKPPRPVVKENYVDRALAARRRREEQRAAKYYGKNQRTIDLGPRGSRQE